MATVLNWRVYKDWLPRRFLFFPLKRSAYVSNYKDGAFVVAPTSGGWYLMFVRQFDSVPFEEYFRKNTGTVKWFQENRALWNTKEVAMEVATYCVSQDVNPTREWPLLGFEWVDLDVMFNEKQEPI